MSQSGITNMSLLLWPEAAKADSGTFGHLRSPSGFTPLVHQLKPYIPGPGIPLSGFDPWRWDLRFYGNYRGTLDMFRQYFQPGLRGIFERADSRVRPLSFGVGYKFKPEETVLILARGRAGDAPPRAERVR